MAKEKIVIGLYDRTSIFPPCKIEEQIIESCLGLTFEMRSSKETKTGHDEMCLLLWVREGEEPICYPLSIVAYIRLKDIE